MQKGESILTRKEKSWAYSKWCEGRTIYEIAEALHVCTSFTLKKSAKSMT